MKRRGHRIVRYADDILILCRSESTANRALEVATQILEVDLKLTVNRDKTHQVHAREGEKFLGVVPYVRFSERAESGIITPTHPTRLRTWIFGRSIFERLFFRFIGQWPQLKHTKTAITNECRDWTPIILLRLRVKLWNAKNILDRTGVLNTIKRVH